MNESSSQLRYFMYARKSSEAEDKQVASVPTQIAELQELANNRNLNVIKIYPEEMSAASPGRPIFNQMLEDIRNGKADSILCWKPDRLARNPVDGGSIIWMLQNNVIKCIQAYTRAYLPIDNMMMLAFEFSQANEYVRDLSQNTKRGMKTQVKAGWFPHKPRIGYLNNKHKLEDKPPIFKDEKNFALAFVYRGYVRPPRIGTGAHQIWR